MGHTVYIKHGYRNRTYFCTYSDKGLVHAVKAQVPKEPVVGEWRNKPEVEVGDDQKRSTSHHPETIKKDPGSKQRLIFYCQVQKYHNTSNPQANLLAYAFSIDCERYVGHV